MSRSTRVPLACASSPGDDTGGGGEHVAPFGEGFIGRDEDRHGEVPAGDDLEEEVGIAVVVVEVSDLVDGQKLRAGEASQTPGEGGVGVLGSEFVEHVGGGGESGGEAVEDGVVEEVLHEHGLPDAVWPHEDDVGGVIDEGEGEQLLDEGAVGAFGPDPVEVGNGLEGADACVGEAAFEGAALAFAVLDVDDALDPWLGEQGVVLGGEAGRVRPRAGAVARSPIQSLVSCSLLSSRCASSSPESDSSFRRS